jgi:hypothetical protein
VERAEHRAGDVPVKALGLQVERIGVGKERREPIRDGAAIRRIDADLDLWSGTFHFSRSHTAPECEDRTEGNG